MPPVQADDSDLEDLLAAKGGGTETAPLNLDHLTQGQLDVPRSGSSNRGPSCAAVADAHCQYLCYAYPKVCGCVSFLGVGFFFIFVLGAVLNPTETFGVIKHDYSDISSNYEQSLGKIDHWCLKGDNDSCRCEDPLEPTSRIEYKSWSTAHRENKKRVEAYRDSELLDIAFIGESLVEEMDGRWMGRTQGDELKSIEKTFKKQFKREKSGIEGVALGIAGDTSPNVLWRLLHGEMPDNFNPRVFWVVLGMNDIGRMQCSEEVVVLGILRVVEEIHKKKPDAKIVINSMLPMADLRGGLYPHMVDYKDAFRQYKGRPTLARPGINPALGKDAAKAGAAAENLEKAKIKYERPQSTTTALRYRHNKGKLAPGVEPTGAVSLPIKEGVAQPAGGTNAAATPPVKQPQSPKEPVKTPAKLPQSSEAAAPKQPVKTKADDGDRRALRIKQKDSDREEDHNPEEPKTKREKKVVKTYTKKIKKDKVNPTLNLDKKKIKARDPKTLFMTQNKLPLWTSINSINKQLEKFAGKHDKISFFDATDIFAQRAENLKYVLQSDKISIRGHPTQAGFSLWHEKIASKLKEMFKKEDDELAKEAANFEQTEAAKKEAGEGKNPEGGGSTSSDDGRK